MSKRLENAANYVKAQNPKAVVAIIIDAADNSIIAAQRFKEEPFLKGLLSQPLPENVYLIITTRIERKHLIPFGTGVKEFTLPEFTLPESTLHVRAVFPEVTDDKCREFHLLTHKNPRILETLDCEARGIKRDTIVNLASMGFVSAATNLIITGATGAGKTYLSCVLGVEACKQTLRTCYIRMPDMLGHFQNHKDNLREQVRYRKRLGNYKVLIIDEWLNYKINERESKFIYELIEQRCGNSPTIFVGQYDVEDWHERLGGGTQADSIMDRIIHNSYAIPTTDNNLRKLYDSQKAKAVIDSLR